MAGTLAPYVFWQATDDNGDPISGGLLFTYEAGTSTKKTTWSDADLTTPNTNPIVLSSAGRAVIYLGTGAYKFVLAPADDTDPPAAPLQTQDNVTAVPAAQSNVDITGIAGENMSANEAVYLSIGLGSKTAGYWYKADATDAYSSSTAGAVGFATETVLAGNSTTIRGMGSMDGFGSLAEGYVYYIDTTPGALVADPPANARPIGVADTSTSLVLLAPVPVVFPVAPRRDIGGGDIVAHIPVILQSGYSGGSTTTPTLTIPGGTLADDDSVVCEWNTDYSSATLSARMTIGGTTKDATTGGNTTVTAARATLTRTSATAIDISWTGMQSAVAMAAHDTVTVLDLDTTDLTITLGMASGTYTIRRYCVTLTPGL